MAPYSSIIYSKSALELINNEVTVLHFWPCSTVAQYLYEQTGHFTHAMIENNSKQRHLVQSTKFWYPFNRQDNESYDS